MDDQRQGNLDEEWKQLCHELEAARNDYLSAEALLLAACDAAPIREEVAADTNAALRDSIEINMRKMDILRRMRLFVVRLDEETGP